MHERRRGERNETRKSSSNDGVKEGVGPSRESVEVTWEGSCSTVISEGTLRQRKDIRGFRNIPRTGEGRWKDRNRSPSSPDATWLKRKKGRPKGGGPGVCHPSDRGTQEDVDSNLRSWNWKLRIVSPKSLSFLEERWAIDGPLFCRVLTA